MLLTAITEITRNANTGARGLKMISSRLVQINDETSSTGKKLKAIYDDLGISVYDANGQLRSTFDILRELSKQWGDLDTNTRQYIALTSAGANQIQNFYALMTNFGTAVEASVTAEKAQGSAWEENAKYMESIEAKYQALKASIEELVLGDGGIAKLIKLVLDLTTSFVKLIDNTGGLTTVIGALGSILMLLNTGSITKLIANLTILNKGFGEGVSNIGVYIGSLILGKEATDSLKTSTVEMAGVIGIATAGVAVAFGLIATAIGFVIKKNKEYQDNINSNILSLGSELKNIESLQKSLSNESITRDELNALIENSSIAYNNELQEIEDVNEARSKAIQLLSEEKKKRAEDVLISGQKQYQKAKNKLDKSYRTTIGSFEFTSDTKKYLENNDLYVDYNISSDNLEDYITKLEKVIKVIQSEGLSVRDNEAIYNKLNNRLTEAKEKYQENIDIVTNYENALNSAGYRYDETIKKVIELTDEEKAYIQVKELASKYTNIDSEQMSLLAKSSAKTGLSVEELAKRYGILNETQVNSISIIDDLLESGKLTQEQYEALKDIINENADDTFDLGEALSQLGINLEEDSEAISTYAELMQEWNDEMDNIQSAYETLSKAVDEYNSSQMYTVDTLQELMNLDPMYLGMLDEENGKLKLNEEKITDVATAHINQAKAIIYENGAKQLNELADQKLMQSQDSRIEKLYEETRALQENTQASVDNAYATYQDAIIRANRAGVSNDEIQNVVKNVNSQINALDKAIFGLGTNFTKSMDSARTATNKAREETSKMKDAVNGLKNKVSELKDEIDKYKTVIDTINDALDKEIDKIEKERDTKLDSIDKQIDAIEELQDKEEKYWDEKIQAYKDENEQIEDQLELQKLLDALQTAKQTKIRVYKEGQGFVWDTDTEAVNKAQVELNKYNRKKAYEEGLKELEDYKKKALDQYEAQIQDLKDYREKEEEEFEKRIKYYQDYKDKFNEQVDEYGNSQNRLLVLQMTGIDLEKENWTERLGNLDDFLLKYKAKLKEAEDAQKALNDAQAKLNSSSEYSSNTSSSGGNGDGGGNGGRQPKTTTTHYVVNGQTFDSKAEADKYAINAKKADEDNINKQIESLKKSPYPNQTYIKNLEDEKSKLGNKYIVKRYASGVSSIGDNQFAIVGENPYQELVIGSKLNGIGMNLSKGTGVVNAKSTSTLAGLFNMLGNQLPSSIGNYSTNNTSNASTNNVTISNITLPNVTKGEEFIDYLKNFSNIMTQKAYSAI